MNKLSKISMTLFISILILGSCKKIEEDAISDTEMLVASAMVDMSYELDFSVGLEQAAQNDSYHPSIPPQGSTQQGCATITVVAAPDGGFPRTFTVDFGDGCDENGFERSGKLIVTLSDYFMNQGCQMTVQRVNYVVNEWKIEGTVIFINASTDANIPTWSRSISNGVFTNPIDEVFTHSGNRTIRQIEGFETVELDDNVYEVSTGTHLLTKQGGTSMTIEILSPIIKDFSCDYLSKGIMKINGKLLNGEIDYGDGTCDSKAVYTHHNGLTFKLNL
jgi:hypothetical protein